MLERLRTSIGHTLGRQREQCRAPVLVHHREGAERDVRRRPLCILMSRGGLLRSDPHEKLHGWRRFLLSGDLAHDCLPHSCIRGATVEPLGAGDDLGRPRRIGLARDHEPRDARSSVLGDAMFCDPCELRKLACL